MLNVKNTIPLLNTVTRFYIWLLLIAILSCNPGKPSIQPPVAAKHTISEVNAAEIAEQKNTIAIVGAMIIDGNGGEPMANGCVIVRDGKIAEVGINGQVDIPDSAEVIDAKGLSLLPGFIDSHFHLDRTKDLPAMFLQNGVTSVRDPGAWIERYADERKSGKPIPRLFLTGPHIDMFPPAYPYDAYVVRDAPEAARMVNKLADDGATAIKVYFRLPPSIIQRVCRAAHNRGLPVTGHLEITEAMEAINAGLDGVEHITSFGLSLQSKLEGEKYRQAVLADNNARKHGRYETWKNIDVNGSLADTLVQFLVRKGTFVSPTLGAFEYQLPRGKEGSVSAANRISNQPLNDFDELPADSVRLMGFNQMKAMTAKLQKGGVRIVLGSHSMIAYAELGWAFQREMELLVESGISASDVIVAATMQNARYFRIDDKLGSIQKGKIADMILVRGNPLEDIRNARNITKVMLNGVWVASKP